MFMCVYFSYDLIIHNNRRIVWLVDFTKENKRFRFGWIEAD